MAKKPKYFIVDAEALPEVFLKVAEAKRMLETGEADTVNRATKVAGISRSAFYKYKDAVRPFNDMLNGFARTGGNILTINQGIPVSGCAAVTIGAETSGLEEPVEDLMNRVAAQEGVIRCEILAG